MNAAVLFPELSKSCDVLNHQILLDKYEICALSGVLKSWFKSHLSNCIQFVETAKSDRNNTLHRYSSLYIETNYRIPIGFSIKTNTIYVIGSNLPRFVQMPIWFYAQITPIYVLVVVGGIKVFEVETALVIK